MPLDDLEAPTWLRSQPERRVAVNAAKLGRQWGWNRMRTSRRLKAWEQAGLIRRNAEAITGTGSVTPTRTSERADSDRERNRKLPEDRYSSSQYRHPKPLLLNHLTYRAGIVPQLSPAENQKHTDSDISVTFTEANVVHVGDTFWNGIYPFIDYSTGGSIDGMIAASNANLAATTNDTIIIPGHGKPVSNKAELREFRDMLVAIRDNVATLKRQGRSRDETVAARPTAAFDAKWGQFVIDPGFFTRLVYEGV
jgi:hypothetical protein